METKIYNTVVVLPNEMKVQVSYYCTDLRLAPGEKVALTGLYIQLDDCLCIMKIEKSKSNNEDVLEQIVHNKVIHDRGHLC